MNTTTPAERWTSLRERFLREPFPRRMGELACALASARSFSDHPEHREVVKTFLDEGAHYLEWVLLDADSILHAELNDLRCHLAEWQNNWQGIWDDPEKRASVAEQAGFWSNKVLERSGLLEPELMSA